MTVFNEDSRVKIPCILHLNRLGYKYISLKNVDWDKDSNIFPDLFQQSISKINPELNVDDIARLLDEATLTLDNEDLGKAFYKKLTNQSNHRLIDLENFDQNSFHVVTELPCIKDEEEFRPDITLLINGMPLVFIEVKKPNNREGILAERNRIRARFQNPKFRRFVNITQLMIFSNNMEYDDTDPEPIQGAFYASTSYENPQFNYFREEETFDLTALLNPFSDSAEMEILKDNNLEVIRTNPEFIVNKDPNRPTNRICTSLLSKDRLRFMLKYAIAYVQEPHGLEKHVMRYPQFFGSRAIISKLAQGVKKGIIWHTQGSGKTALAYYGVNILTNYFQKRQIIPKFYFIVDRLDLLTQAQGEFTARGLKVHTINSREDFAQDIRATQVIHNDSGEPEITVVNIQKFKEDPDVVATEDYDIDVQRIYFLDEVHRSYNPRGSFLANLKQSDKNAIKIGLTGTPLLGNDFNSKDLFGNYIHKYYYNASIADGYTLRLIREEIETNYKIILQEALEAIEVKMGDIDRRQVYSHSSFVQPMLEYILTDFEKSRVILNDSRIGGMVICDSAEQAKEMYDQFQNMLDPQAVELQLEDEVQYAQVAESSQLYNSQKNNKVATAALILHDVGTKEDRKDWIDDFKTGKIDFLFVFNMLQTGFDAKRLKKLYLGRVVRRHNLLQALTRVNRPFNDHRYGYVVDFADIRKEFDATNEAYFKELQAELGDEMEHYSQLFKSPEEIKEEIEHLKDILFRYDTENAEKFADQISQIYDREVVLNLKKALADARSLYNLIRLQGEYTFLGELDFQKLNLLYREASNHLDLLNLKESIENGANTTNLLNVALEDIVFKFTKIGEEELILADELKETLRQTREEMASNFDQQDPKFLTLKAELERLFKKKKLSEVSQEEMGTNIATLKKIYSRVKALNQENEQLRQKYNQDRKFTRIHKRLLDQSGLGATERKLYEALRAVKRDADEEVMQNTQVLKNESYFEKQMMPIVIRRFMKDQQITLNPEVSKYVNRLLVTEYLNEYYARVAV